MKHCITILKVKQCSVYRSETILCQGNCRLSQIRLLRKSKRENHTKPREVINQVLARFLVDLFNLVIGALLARERWDVEKIRRQLNAEIETEYDKSISYVQSVHTTLSKKAVEIYTKAFSRLQFGFPPPPVPYRDAVIRYCRHLLSFGVDKYRKSKTSSSSSVMSKDQSLESIAAELSVWLEKSIGTVAVRVFPAK